VHYKQNDIVSHYYYIMVVINFRNLEVINTIWKVLLNSFFCTLGFKYGKEGSFLVLKPLIIGHNVKTSVPQLYCSNLIEIRYYINFKI